ncbi:uncharacterized protein LOC126995353 [Eriocheir sinensis]|uniref:uncharacterized protein LOC126995353 n=1 Tax=Eriocheir sinensis TaxID=95602 RepID=UPI0021C9B50C|nr:uncharacterized protein LOC126995353 [Eriocheir sinensis]
MLSHRQAGRGGPGRDRDEVQGRRRVCLCPCACVDGNPKATPLGREGRRGHVTSGAVPLTLGRRRSPEVLQSPAITGTPPRQHTHEAEVSGRVCGGTIYLCLIKYYNQIHLLFRCPATSAPARLPHNLAFNLSSCGHKNYSVSNKIPQRGDDVDAAAAVASALTPPRGEASLRYNRVGVGRGGGRRRCGQSHPFSRRTEGRDPAALCADGGGQRRSHRCKSVNYINDLDDDMLK